MIFVRIVLIYLAIGAFLELVEEIGERIRPEYKSKVRMKATLKERAFMTVTCPVLLLIFVVWVFIDTLKKAVRKRRKSDEQ